jgi:hypothetical protein
MRRFDHTPIVDRACWTGRNAFETEVAFGGIDEEVTLKILNAEIAFYDQIAQKRSFMSRYVLATTASGIEIR